MLKTLASRNIAGSYESLRATRSKFTNVRSSILVVLYRLVVRGNIKLRAESLTLRAYIIN